MTANRGLAWEETLPRRNPSALNSTSIGHSLSPNRKTDALVPGRQGRDEFTAMRKAKLFEAVAAQDYERICQAFDKEKYQLSALRWLLRGLSMDKAIRKVEVDREIGHEAAERREVDKMRWDDDD